MAKTLLAVDDSVTMRKVLEITFSGENFHVVTTDTAQGAIGSLSENPQVCVIDTALGSEDGYALAKELRRRSPNTAIIMLASRYAPYDQARGRDAGADDWTDKPFDTQQLIDKVRKVMLAKEAGGAAAAAPAPAPAPTPPPQPVATPRPTPPAAAPSGGYRPATTPSQPLGRGTQPSLSSSVPRTGTLVFGENAPSAPAPAPRPGAASAPAQAMSAAVNGQLSGKLGELGLTPQQAEAVLALSREVVERIVWEVVPQLAEAIIKEEITRLTNE